MLTGSEQPKRILVVDDDAEIRGMLATALRPHGLIVDLAENGREALDLLRENVYTVMVLDLLMPVADGFTVLDGLRARDAQPMPVVLVLTGAETRVVRQLDPRVVHGIIKKPFDLHDLTDLVVACADIRGRGAFEAMALAAVVAGSPLMAWLSRMS